ncbi:MAG: RluA family pseudouridine synthase, partial [Hyphomicrobiaceae bacterium]|nr:RluA family pseudouridine synthase [Hyphomicrobiaceae bacterium]
MGEELRLGVTQKAVGPDETGMRLDRWFREHVPGLAFGHLQKLLRSGQIRIDGARAKADTRLAAGQTVRIPPIRVEAPQEKTAKPSDADFLRNLLLHEDEQVFVFNKPHGLAVQGGSGTTRHMDGLLEALRDRQGRKPRLVHRIDKDTSGILVVARTKGAATALAASFRARETQKVYWALVRGVPKPKQGRISTYVARKGPRGEERMEIVKHG